MMQRIIFLSILSGFSLFSQQSPVYPGRIATWTDMNRAVDNETSFLSQTLSTYSTSIQVQNASSFVAPGIITIESEQIQFCNVVGNVLYACSGGRGFANTLITQHNNGAAVNGYSVAWSDNQKSLEIMSIQNSLGPNLSNVALVGHTHSFSQITGLISFTMIQDTNYVTARCANNAPGYGRDWSVFSSGSPPAVCLNGSNTVLGVLQYQSTGQSAQVRLIPPSDWISNTPLSLTFTFTSATASATGNVVWSAQYSCDAPVSGSLDHTFYTPVNLASVHAIANNLTNQASVSFSTSPNCSPGSIISLKIGLDPSTTASGYENLTDVKVSLKRKIQAQ